MTDPFAVLNNVSTHISTGNHGEFLFLPFYTNEFNEICSENRVFYFQKLQKKKKKNEKGVKFRRLNLRSFIDFVFIRYTK